MKLDFHIHFVCRYGYMFQDTKYIATDSSQGFLDVLREKSPNLDATVCSASDIPLPDCSVQVKYNL